MESSCSVIQTPCNMAVELDHGGASGWTRWPRHNFSWQRGTLNTLGFLCWRHSSTDNY